jgi:tape measure domain-containing protein
MASLGDMIARVGVDLSEFNSAMGTIPQKFGEAADAAEQKWSSLDAMGTRLMGVGTALTAAITVPLVGVGAAAVKTSEELNMANIAFTTMLGSADKAGEFLKELQKFAASTPFQFTELVDAAKRMQAFGFESSQVIPTLRIIGDTVSLMGGGKDAIDGITRALGQMQAKGKVSAEEMNQLAERNVKAWEFLAQGIGVSIPDAMKLAEKGAISASVAIPAILDGMNAKFSGGMEKASQTLTGVWSNFKDQATVTLAEMGNIIAPALKSVVELAMPLLNWAKDAVMWFSQLPEPIQKGALAFAAMAAAIGPVLLAAGGLATAVSAIGTALAPIATVLGVTTAAFSAWALAIPLVTAALVALGVWVYDNWEPIKASLVQAWDGVTDIWHAIWDPLANWIKGVWEGIASIVAPIFKPIVTILSFIWDPVVNAMKTVWNGIASFLSGVWDGIASAASSIWGSIVKTFQTFLDWAAKIPGVNKLMNLDDAWNSAKKLEEQTKKTTVAVKDHAQSHASGAPKVKISTDALAKHTKGLTDAEKAAVRMQKANEEMTSRYEREAKEYIRAAEGLNRVTRDLEKSNSDLAIMFGKAHESMRAETLKTVEIIVPLTKRIPQVVQDAIKSNKDLEAAYKQLGITSSEELGKQVEANRKAYETIKNSGTSSVRDIDAAWVKYEEARIAAAKATGEQITKEQQMALDKMKEQLGVSTGQQKDKWTDWSKQVSTIVTDLGRDLSGILFDGDKSWAEKGQAALSALGQAFMRSFVEPVTTAAADLLSGVLADLIGGKGFGGVLDSIKSIGGAVKDVFSGATGGVGGVPSGGGGGIPTGGGGGASSGGIGGLAGGINLVSGIVSAVSGIIGNFQNAKQETTLNAIEHNTRYSMMFLGERGDGGILGRLFDIADKMQYVPTLLDGVNAKLSDWLSPLSNSGTAIEEAMPGVRMRLDEISNNTLYGMHATQDAVTAMREVRDAINRRGTEVNIYVSGAGSPQSTANAVAAQLRTQMAI